MQAISRLITLVGVAVGGFWVHAALKHEAHPPYDIHFGLFVIFLGAAAVMAIGSALAGEVSWMLEQVKNLSAPQLVSMLAGLAAIDAGRHLVTDHVSGGSLALEEAARGDLAVPVPHPADAQLQPSLETLSTSMEHMLGDLRGLVGHVRCGGEQVGASAAELLATAE